MLILFDLVLVGVFVWLCVYVCLFVCVFVSIVPYVRVCVFICVPANVCMSVWVNGVSVCALNMNSWTRGQKCQVK